MFPFAVEAAIGLAVAACRLCGSGRSRDVQDSCSSRSRAPTGRARTFELVPPLSKDARRARPSDRQHRCTSAARRPVALQRSDAPRRRGAHRPAWRGKHRCAAMTECRVLDDRHHDAMRRLLLRQCGTSSTSWLGPVGARDPGRAGNLERHRPPADPHSGTLPLPIPIAASTANGNINHSLKGRIA